MPWHLETDNPECSGVAVVKDADGKVVGCHPDKEKAKAQLAALYANEPRSTEDPPMTDDPIHHAPRDDLYRAMQGGITSEDGKTLTIRLAPHDQWAEIQSQSEGHFLERFTRTAYRKTMAEHPPKILFQHGKDPAIGEKPIATTDEVGEDETSPFARGRILDGLPELVVDGLRKGVYGASHRFSVIREKWEDRPVGGPHNPNKLPERTISEARLFELGPVTWPAYAQASASLRSMTDEMRPIPTPPVAPSLDAAADAPHLEPERRDEPVPPSKPDHKETSTVEYVTRDEKAARVTELRDALAALAVEYPGVLPDEAQARWDNQTAELDRLKADINAWDERQQRLVDEAARQDAATQVRVGAAPAVIRRPSEADIYDLTAIERSSSTREQRDQKLRDNAMRAVEQVVSPHPSADQDGFRSGLTTFLDYRDTEDKEFARRIITTGSPQYRRDFARYVRTGGAERGTALAVGVDGTGGYAVPYAFDPTVLAIGAHTTLNPFRQVCRVETIVGTDTYQVLTATAITAAYALEAAAATEQGPTFARPEFIAKRAHAFVTVSYEMAQDRPGLDSDLAGLFQEAKDNLEENQFAVGVGTTVYPQGVALDGAFTAVTTATNDTTAVGDLFLVEAGLPLRYRANAIWMMTRKGIRAAQGWETAYGQLFNGVGYPNVGRFGRPDPVNSNTGLTLIGYPLWEAPSIPWTPTTDATINGVLFDPSRYLILDRVGMSIKVIPDMLNGATPSFPTGEIGIYAFWRNTARVVNADAGRQLKVQ